MIQFLSKIFRSVLHLLSAELPDSRGICAVGEPNCMTEKWWPIFYLIWQIARPAMRGTQLYKDWTQHTFTALRHFETEKWWPNFCLISRAARHSARAQFGAARWWEGHSRFKNWTQHTFTAPLPPPPPPSPSYLVTLSLGAKKADLPTWLLLILSDILVSFWCVVLWICHVW